MRSTARRVLVVVPVVLAGLVALGFAQGAGGVGRAGAPAPAQGAASPGSSAAEYRTAMEQADLAIQKENHDHS